MKPHTPPNINRAATNNIGMNAFKVIRFPNAKFPKIAPILPKTAWIPNAVDLRKEGSDKFE